MREWEWKFDALDVIDYDDMPDTIVSVRVYLVLKDYDLDMVEMTDLSAIFDPPQTEDFIDYDSVTPETIRDWVIWFHSKGNETWLTRVQEDLTLRLEKRAATRSRVMRARLVE